MRPSAAQVNNSFPSQNDIQLLIPFLHSYQPLHLNRFWVRSYCPRCSIWHQLDLHQPSPRRADFGWNNRCFQNDRKCEPFHLILDAAEVFSQKFLILFNFILHLTSYHARYFLRKHLRKSRNLTVSSLKMILLSLIFKLSISQSSTQLMVRKSHAQVISLQQSWTKNFPWCLQMSMLRVQSRFNQILLVHHQLFLLFRQRLL